MEADLAEAIGAEQKVIGIYDELIAAKEKQINTDTAAIESKIERIGNLGVEIETTKADLSDTAASMIEDEEFLAYLDKTCKTKQAEWGERCKVRNEELPWRTLSRCSTMMIHWSFSGRLFQEHLPSCRPK